MMTSHRDRWNLFLCSFTILFVELTCIRWIPAYVRTMGYFTNFVLLGSFLGIGLGILQARRRLDLLTFFPVILALLVGVISLFKITITISASQEYFFATQAHGTEAFFLLPLVFAVVALLFTMLGQNLGRLLAAVRPPLTAYTLDIAGSIAGSLLFALVSFLGAQPGVWFAIAALAVLLLPQPRGVVWGLNAILLAGVVVWVAVLGHTSLWSPYYRIDMTRYRDGGIVLSVNAGINYQSMGNYASRKRVLYYSIPFQTFHFPPSARELIIGAGSGSDADIALHYGLRHITAVELDPTIYDLGRRLNIDHPYQSPAVHVVIDDGRAFLEHTRGTYDLIVFAATDSLALTSSFANLRTESYLFTREAFAAARRHLSPRGIVVLYNYYRKPWIVHKFAGMLAHAFGGQIPYGRIYGGGVAAVLMDGPRLRELPPSVQGVSPIRPATGLADATDDWPFPYLSAHTIATVYLQAVGLVVLLAAVALGLSVRWTAWRRFDLPLFFTGLAFLLLEAKSIVNFSLLFGVTWLVNALVIVGILCTVLLANWINAATRVRLPIRPLYLGLAVTLALNLLVPLHILLGLDLAPRYGLGCALLFSPVLLANLIFGRLFGDVMTPDVAFASNLLGAFVGGLLEYVSLVIGYQQVLLLVAAAYALSFVAVASRRGGSVAGVVQAAAP